MMMTNNAHNYYSQFAETLEICGKFLGYSANIIIMHTEKQNAKNVPIFGA